MPLKTSAILPVDLSEILQGFISRVSPGFSSYIPYEIVFFGILYIISQNISKLQKKFNEKAQKELLAGSQNQCHNVVSRLPRQTFAI